MRKLEFFRQLEYLLQDVPEADKNEAISYYMDYLEDAGPENEEQVLNEFGSPERIAAIIRTDINGNLEDGGSFTEKGYVDERFRDPNYQLTKRMDLPDEWSSGNAEDTQKNEKAKPRTNGCLKVVLWAVLLAVAAPILFGFGGTAMGVLIAVIVVIAVILLLVGVLTLVALFTGAALVISGVAALFQEPVEAVFIIGLGLLLAGVGLLGLLASFWFYGKLVPWAFRGIGKGIDSVSDRIRRH